MEKLPASMDFSEADAQSILDHFDRDKDKKLNTSEFEHFFAKWNKYKTPQIDVDSSLLQKAFANSDGFITKADLLVRHACHRGIVYRILMDFTCAK